MKDFFGKKKKGPAGPSEEAQNVVSMLQSGTKFKKCGGANSGVYRFEIPTNASGKRSGKMAYSSTGGLYCFLRCSPMTPEGVKELYKLLSVLVTHLKLEFRTTGKKCPLEMVPPNSLLACTAGDARLAGFQSLTFSGSGKNGNDYIEDTFNPKSLMIVSGVTCNDMLDWLSKSIPNWGETKWSEFMFALGVSHALDVMTGNGDRLHHPNWGNVFIGDQFGSCILVDIDCIMMKKQDIGCSQKWSDLVIANEHALYVKSEWVQKGAGPHAAKFDHYANNGAQDALNQDYERLKTDAIELHANCVADTSNRADIQLLATAYERLNIVLSSNRLKDSFMQGGYEAFKLLRKKRFIDLANTCKDIDETFTMEAYNTKIQELRLP